jgi:uncharacterized membrane protein required for colicin V production
MTGIVLDLIVAVVVIMLLLFGLWRGAFKIIFGLVSSLLAIILAVVFVSSATQLVISKTTIDDRIQASIDASISTKIPNANVEIQLYDIDGDGVVAELGYDSDGTIKAFDTLLDGTTYSILSGTIESIITPKLVEGDEVVFSTILVATLVGYIMLAITFIALLILFEILVKALMSLLRKFVTKTFFGHFIDKFLGGVLGLGLSAVIVYGALAIIKLMGTYSFIIPANTLIEESTLVKWLFNNNYLYNLVVNSFNAKAIIDSILAKITSVSAS